MPQPTEVGLIRRAIGKWLQRALYLNNVSYSGGGGWQGGWWPNAILESFSGAWQTNVVAAPTSTLLSFSPVFACVTGIAADISKVRVMLSRNEDGIWTEVTENQPWLPVLRNPNHYQDHLQFFESWMLSKLMYGNTYILKERDRSTRVSRLYILHPSCVKPLISEDRSVYYELKRDDLSGLTNERLLEMGYTEGRVVVPASEIIHDRFNTLWHPLVGVSPLYACGTTATMGNTIQTNSTNVFANGGRPSGVVTVPGTITDATALRLKNLWETNFGGTNVGKTAVLSDGMTFAPVNSMSAEMMQLIEQLKWTREDVSIAFRYPLWKMGGAMPPYTKPDQAQTLYYSDCLHPHVEKIEKCLKDGLELPLDLNAEFEIDALMRMDKVALYEALKMAEGWTKLDEQRYVDNRKPLPVGGDTVYKQHQDYSVEALAKRDAKPDPFATTPAPAAQPAPAPEPKAAEPVRAEPTQEEITAMLSKFETYMRSEMAPQ